MKKNDAGIFSISTFQIRNYMVLFNWYRLFTIRIRRFFETSLALSPFTAYNRIVGALNSILFAIFLFVAWIFYIPRFTVNFLLLLKHLVSPWMLKLEAKLSFWARLTAQMQRRGFELANDSVWLLVGVLNCFTQLLAPYAFFLPLALALYDSLLAWGRSVLDLNRLKNGFYKYAQVERTMKRENQSPESIKEIQEYKTSLGNRISLEKTRHTNSIHYMNNLVTGVILTMFAAPLLPFLGTFWILVVTTIAYSRWKKLQEKEQTLFPDTRHRKCIKQSIKANLCFFGEALAHTPKKSKDATIRVPATSPESPHPLHFLQNVMI